MGRNVQYLSERFGACSLDVIDSSKQWKLMADEGICRNDSRAGHAWLGMVYCACLLDDFTHNDVLALTEHLCVD